MEYVSAAHVAESIGVTARAVTQMCVSGKLPPPWRCWQSAPGCKWWIWEDPPRRESGAGPQEK